MDDHKLLQHRIMMIVILLLVSGCSSAPASPALVPPSDVSATLVPPTTSPAPRTPSVPPATLRADPVALWEDATKATIGITGQWTNKVELADINGDGRVDILFANGGDYETPGTPVVSRVFLNQGSGSMFKEVTQEVFGPVGMLARVIKVRDVNGDEQPDILVGTTFQTQSQLYLAYGGGKFRNVTATHLPAINASIGDAEFGDVDSDGDLDIVLADWGPGSPMSNAGGRTLLWLNDGTGHFADATSTRMPNTLVKFSWELEFVDVENDYDLDILVSCKKCAGSFFFENDGAGMFTDVTKERLPQFTNNYEFEAMDVNADAYLDLVTINDGGFSEHVFLNNRLGGFEDATAQLWPTSENPSRDDNMVAFLDFDSDADADFLIGSLDGPDRLLINDGAGHLKVVNSVFKGNGTPGTLAIALADLNGDHKLDVVQAQGEVAVDDRVFLGVNIQPDTAPPIITLVEQITSSESGQAMWIRARVHDNKSPTLPHDWQSVVVRWSANGQTNEVPMQWYGEYLWRGVIDEPPPGALSYQVCATDAAGNSACSALLTATP